LAYRKAVVPSGETVLERHPEAEPKDLLFVNHWKSRCFAFAQHDMQRIYNVLKQSRGSAIYQVAEKIFRNLLGKISPFSRNDICFFLAPF
jgi:hypothetical protein